MNKIGMTAAFLAVMMLAGAATATTTTTILGNTNTPQLAGIKVSATYDDVAKTISVQYVAGSAPVANTVLGIDKIYYNLANTVSSGPAGWNFNVPGPRADSFGEFLSNKNSNPSGTDGISSPIVFTLSDFTLPIAANGNGATTAVHIRFSNDCSGWVSDGTAGSEPNLNCSAPPAPVPELNPLILVSAGLLGLMLLARRYRR